MLPYLLFFFCDFRFVSFAVYLLNVTQCSTALTPLISLFFYDAKMNDFNGCNLSRLSQRQIVKQLGLSRNTIKKYVEAKQRELKHSARPKRLSKLDEFKPYLHKLLTPYQSMCLVRYCFQI